MSNIEHMIDSAISYLDNSYTFEDWKDTWSTNVNRQGVTATLEEIWTIANWIYYDYKPSVELKTRIEMENDYGYKI